MRSLAGSYAALKCTLTPERPGPSILCVQRIVPDVPCNPYTVLPLPKITVLSSNKGADMIFPLSAGVFHSSSGAPAAVTVLPLRQ